MVRRLVLPLKIINGLLSGKLGIVMNTNFYLPEDDSEESLAVQELAMQFTVSRKQSVTI